MESFIIIDKYLIKFYYSFCNYMVFGVFLYRIFRCDGLMDKRIGKYFIVVFNSFYGLCGIIF